jgi:anti-sigma B factor antagonist
MVEVPGFALKVTENGHGPVVLLSGELDLGAAGQFRECLHQFSDETVTLDFTAVTFLDSSAIGVLVGARNRADEAGGAIVLHGVQPPQMRIFEITGLTEHLNFDGDGTAD